jgi:hypothetical protein
MRKHIAEEHVPLLRRALAASDERELHALGQHGAIDDLVDEKITEGAVTVYDELIAAELAGMGMVPWSASRLPTLWRFGSDCWLGCGMPVGPTEFTSSISERIVH